MVTEDHDDEKIASEFWTSGENFYGIAFVLRQGVSLGALINDLEMIAACSEVDEIINRIVYVPLK